MRFAGKGSRLQRVPCGEHTKMVQIKKPGRAWHWQACLEDWHWPMLGWEPHMDSQARWMECCTHRMEPFAHAFCRWSWRQISRHWKYDNRNIQPLGAIRRSRES